jgi:hypothetical protein
VTRSSPPHAQADRSEHPEDCLEKVS